MSACPVEDRLALQDLVVAHAQGVDSLHDLDGICAVFTPDAVFDLSGIGFPSVSGHAGIRSFYAAAFEAMAAQAHYVSNFAVTAYGGDTASIRSYVTGMGRYKAGGGITIHGRYYYDAVRTGSGWKATRFTMDFLIPPDA
ncbi:nuclear transport factor 2 family protein [Sphingomonas populi]|uniref:Nuclear transport factor 2 family protein n=1 Tax=Sphingomonas populi TaxID=2484750 RepID=A0A4V2DCZ4_9SPHN|nr:nuclear transport factor 2 family protein [Sphingomonas populi]RZF63198.1 nuclear transport factor 2 family protein [Sphingomonas populi]